MALTMNYKRLQEQYAKPKKIKKQKIKKSTKEGIEYYIKLHQEHIKKLKLKIAKHENQIKNLKIQLSGVDNEYVQLLKSTKWRDKRNEILELKGKKCSECGSTENLQVHHLYYKKNTKPWDYPDDAFVVLCEDCHKKVHGIK